MGWIKRSCHGASRLRGDERGVALIEFAIALPLTLLLFAVIIEGGRMMMGYQAAISGVRDASRYMARLVQPNVCTTNPDVSTLSAKLLTIARTGQSGANGLPNGISIDSVTPSYRCVSGSYRSGQLPIAQLTAQITITYPFAGVFTLVGGSLPTITRTVTDEERIFGS